MGEETEVPMILLGAEKSGLLRVLISAAKFGHFCERSEHHSLRVETGDQTSTNGCLKEPGIFDGRCCAFCLRRFSINGSKILVMDE